MIPQELKCIIDLTIGDGYINKKGTGGRIEHSVKQKEYAQHKEQLLKSLNISLQSREYTVQNGNNAGKSYYQINIHKNPYLLTARKWLYNKNRKALDKALFRQLDEKSLAYWFMDDGSAKLVKYNQKGSIRYIYTTPKIGAFKFSNQSFTYEENMLMVHWLWEKFQIKARITNNNGYEVFISDQQNKEKFLSVIQPFIHPSLFYKIQYPLNFEGIEYSIVQRDRLSGVNP